MKKIFALSVLLLSFSSLAGSIEVKVSGMVCSMCAQGIQKKFKQHKEVKELSVDMDNKVVSIQTVEGKDLSDEVITKVITEAGYNVSGIIRK